jgi:hypothetical protein
LAAAACLVVVVESGKPSALGRPEAGCWGHGKPASRSGGFGARRSGLSLQIVQ